LSKTPSTELVQSISSCEKKRTHLYQEIDDIKSTPKHNKSNGNKFSDDKGMSPVLMATNNITATASYPSAIQHINMHESCGMGEAYMLLNVQSSFSSLLH